MAYQVHGEDISEEEFSQDQGWQSAGARRAGAKKRTADSNEPSPPSGSRRGKLGGAALKSKVLRAEKMPPLPRDDIKIVIRPRGGLNISKIGAAAVADAILAAAGISQEDFAYETAPHSTCKGVIRNIPLQDDPDVIDAKIVNTNNPLALAAKRIAQTGTVIVAFDGYRVPNFVRYGPVLMQCSLYRKQIDVCYACSRLGHRTDVCPTPGDMICRGCGVEAPMSSMCVPPSASYVVASISRLAKTVLEGSRSRTSCVVFAVNAPKWLVPRNRPRNVSPILRTSSKLRRPPRMLSAEDAPSPGAALEAIPDPGAVVPQGDVPAPAPGRQNGLIRGDAPLLSLAPAPRRGTTRRGEPGRAPARPPPLRARRSRRSPGPTRHEKDVSLLEATTRLAVLPTRRSSTSSDELMSS
ncbi:hypothetical protein HPB52_024350 [Rhipicephalus sanguineus]|uniref:CCHC-type domain-containing protein n=1 Tax=Rhipicephalus sanguineus TaxID=34632 RepID=A0A9D4TEC3_RHISA|nr:hypothetical protein HPB52_024350 [Rhipicephalus sanguineus]